MSELPKGSSPRMVRAKVSLHQQVFGGPDQQDEERGKLVKAPEEPHLRSPSRMSNRNSKEEVDEVVSRFTEAFPSFEQDLAERTRLAECEGEGDDRSSTAGSSDDSAATLQAGEWAEDTPSALTQPPWDFQIPDLSGPDAEETPIMPTSLRP
ncbi:uncharacterized protein LTR77_004778 [Saxophila tyrrhenica]|uniref:Uncharacterized protein n=1 Tax=Saxophila tyrrhenica TaxID=1690608 RepID=A0AAV9PD71_9PEZI|nr:hypothetical protein LTR77_004778 [Saxophila tyrrhenica]